MAIVYVILVAVALALAVFAVAVQKGASIVNLDRRLVESGIVAGVMQLAAAVVGYGFGALILSREIAAQKNVYWIHVLAGFLLAVIGIRMLMLAFQKRTILEHRMEKIDVKADTIAFLRLCFHSLLAGIAFGLTEVNLLFMLLMIFLTTIAFAIAGYLSGRAYGGESNNKAYAIGGGVLCVVGICLQIIG